MVIALSGKCCSGKNYISDIIKKRGFKIIDVDVISSRIFGTLNEHIIKIFGDSVLSEGYIDRRKVGDILFKDSTKRVEFENIIHPLIYNEILKTLDDNPEEDYLINIPLLKQSIIIPKLTGIIWIKSPLLLRFYRATKRDNYNFKTIIRRILTQKKLSVKHLKTTVDIYYIYNSWFSIKLEKNLVKILNRLQ